MSTLVIKTTDQKSWGILEQAMFARISVAPDTQQGRVLPAWLSLLIFHIASLSLAPLFPQICHWGAIARNYAQRKGMEMPALTLGLV